MEAEAEICSRYNGAENLCQNRRTKPVLRATWEAKVQ